MLVNLRVHVKPEKGKWLKKMLRKCSQGGGEGGSSLAYKTGGAGQGGRGQGAGKIKEEGGRSLQAFRVATTLHPAGTGWAELRDKMQKPARKGAKP